MRLLRRPAWRKLGVAGGHGRTLRAMTLLVRILVRGFLLLVGLVAAVTLLTAADGAADHVVLRAAVGGVALALTALCWWAFSAGVKAPPSPASSPAPAGREVAER